MSVTPAGHVLVVCRGETCRLVELVVDGGSGPTMRQIRLPADVCGPCHAVQTTPGHYFVVAQRGGGGGQSGLVVVDADGRLTDTYPVSPRPTRADRDDDDPAGELACPCHVTVDRHFLLVVDHDNHRVVSLSRSLRFLHEVVAVTLPNRLYLDHATRRLYIGHGCGVTVVHL